MPRFTFPPAPLLTMLTLLLATGLLSPVRAQLLLPSTTPVTTEFSTLGKSATAAVPTGFQLSKAALPEYNAAANFTATTQAAGSSGAGAVTGSSTGGTYNFASGVTATSTDRALGFLTSGGYGSPLHILLAAKNTTGSPIASLAISFDIEQYRTGSRAFDWQFFTSPDGTTWTEVPAGSQNFPAAAANTPVNPPATTAKSLTLSDLNLAPNAIAYLRWSYVGSGGGSNSHGLALDNLVLTASTSTTPITPTITTGTITGSPFCVPTAGAAVSVPFTSTGTLTGTFSAQLSNANGLFAADPTQNLIGSGSGSPLSATIPTATPAGNGYRIRVVNAAATGTANMSDLTLNPAPTRNSVSISPAAAQSFVATGQGTSLTATPAAASAFAWLYATSATGPFTTAISGATPATYTPRGADFGPAGTYYLVARATSSCGGVVATSTPVAITTTVAQPTLSFLPAPVPDFGRVAVGGASAAQTVSVSSTNLSQPVTITPPPGFEIRTGTGAFSCCALTFMPGGGTLSASFDVRFTPTVAQAYATMLAVASPDLPTAPGIDVSGTGVAPIYPATISATAPATALTATTATSGGTIATDGGSAVTARGVVYGLSPAPTLAEDEFTQAGEGTSTFTSALSGLAPNTLYYARTYATTSAGTSYGPQISFTTLPVPLADEPTQNPTLTAGNLTPRDVLITLSGGNGAKHLLLVIQGPDLAAQPTDATTYPASAVFGQGAQPTPGTFVVLAGVKTAVTVSGLSPGTEYSFAVYDYNDNNTAGAENYLLSAPPGRLTLTTPSPPAGLLLTDDFTYPAGELLTAHGWSAHSGGGSNAIRASAAAGLSYDDYSPADGPAAALTATGEDVNRTFESQAPGTPVYVSVLVNVSQAKSAEYFLHLGPDPIGSAFRARVFVKAAATAGKLQFGISGSSGTATFAPTEYDENATYLLTLRYSFGPAGTETRLYVNPPAATEPAQADAVSTEAASTAPTNIGSVALRQSAGQSPMLLDGLRVATSYELARPAAPEAPLPVTLLFFSGERTATGVRLRWSTAQQVNAREFQLQRSPDARSFTTVATVPAAGTTTSAHSYVALDSPPVGGASALYYRLRQVDLDGRAHYSHVVALAPAGSAALPAGLSVAPNPAYAGAPLTLTLRGRAGQALRLELLDATGRIHHRQPLRAATNAEQLPLRLPAHLPAGLYLLRVIGTGPGAAAPLQTRLMLTR
ncbi:hypothetical protein [Hymenobacter actinosclerus]|nr:hypothetical protein [Hymenobacter actinosclerus]